MNNTEEKFYKKFTEKKSAKKDKGKISPNQHAKSGNQKKEAYEKNKKQENFSTQKHNFSIINSQFSEANLQSDSQYVLTNFDDFIQGVRPLNSKQLQQLPENIRALSHQLTDQRSERRLGYMNENVQLSAYVRYYTWWNLVRLTRLFANLPKSAFPEKDCVCLDLGSGPLTVITALWLARPELRKLKLTWYCLDVSANSMALGEDIFLSVAARTQEAPWNIIRVKGSFGTSIKQKADFVTCANMFNELDQASHMPPEFQSKKYFDQLKIYSTSEAKFLLIEPGVPKATRTLTLLRERFVKNGKQIIAPCPHGLECPMSGFKAYTGSQNKWCNFAFSTESAPVKLQKISEKAKLPKERATLIFISVGNEKSENNLPEGKILCRVTSDAFRLPANKTGYYACSNLGLTLLSVNKRFDMENPGENSVLNSGDLIEVTVKTKTPDFASESSRDEKSGAIKIDVL